MSKEKYIEERKNKDGVVTSYRVNAKFPDGNSYRKTYSLSDYKTAKECMKAAIKERNRVLAEYDAGRFVAQDKQNITVGELFEMIPDYTSKRQGTYRKYKIIYGKWIAQKCGNKKISEVTRADIEKILKNAAETCVRQHVSNILTVWKIMYDIAIYDLDLNIKNRALKVDFPECNHVTERSKSERNISETDFQNFCSFMAEYGHYLPTKCKQIYNRDIMLLCLRLNRFLGLRPQEIRAISKSDVEFLDLRYFNYQTGKEEIEKGIKVHVWRSVGSTLTQKVALTNLKTAGSERYVYGGAEARKIVEELFAYSKYDVLFSDYDGNLISATAMSDYIGRVSRQWNKKNGTDISVYSVLMRKAMASDNYNNAVNPIVTKNMMGHVEVNTSANWYAGSNAQDQINATLNRKFKE